MHSFPDALADHMTSIASFTQLNNAERRIFLSSAIRGSHAGGSAPVANRRLQAGHGPVPEQLQPRSVWAGDKPRVTSGAYHLLPCGGGGFQSLQ